MKAIQNCRLCPRACGTDRRKARGLCGAGEFPTVAKIMLHRWEEPCICYGKGSGAVFFSGCPLRCIFCQNHAISRTATGKELSPRELTRIFLSLEEKGACNLNLVSPTPYRDDLIDAVKEAKKEGLSLPVVINTGGYETAESIQKWEGVADIYLPDFKFADPLLAKEYAAAPDYPSVCREAIRTMVRQSGPPVWEGDRLKRGTIVRHLILPGGWEDSKAVLSCLRKDFGEDGIVVSLMRQYTPTSQTAEHPFLKRRLTTLEYQKVYKEALRLGFRFLYTQKKESASEEFIPDFGVFFRGNRLTKKRRNDRLFPVLFLEVAYNENRYLRLRKFGPRSRKGHFEK